MKKWILAAILGCIALHASAQHPTLAGTVSGEGAQPIAYATVVLLAEGRQQAGTTTDEAGHFDLTAPAGDYTITVHCMGYASCAQPIGIGNAAAEPLTIRLTPSATEIGEVVVRTGGIERRADRFVVEVGGDAAIGKDGAEVVAEAPGVWLDDERLSINGTSGTKVFVDDRELRLEGEQLTAYLRTLRAEEIRRVEVIPQAGADYAADTRGGVIRITLRKRRDDGMNGSLTATTSQGARLADYAPAANLSLRRGGWLVNASGSGSLVTRGETEYVEMRTYADGNTRFRSPSRTCMRQNYGTGRLGLIREFGARHTLGAEVEYTARGLKAPAEASTSLTRSGIETVGASDYRQRSGDHTLTATLNYIFLPDTLGTSFKFIADYLYRTADGDNDYFTLTRTGDETADTTYRNSSSSRSDIFTADAAFEQPLGRGMRLKAGAHYTYTRTQDTARYEGLAEGWRPRPEYGRQLDYTEHIGALYALFSADVGRWSLSAGLRGEYARTQGRGDAVRCTAADLFPSANVTYAIDRMRTWMLVAQYARNIERPGFWSLNPNRIQISDYTYTVGNPDLRPTYIHRLSLTAVFRYRFTLTVGGNLHRDLIREERLTDPSSPDLSRIVPMNHRTENHWFVALNLPFRPGKRWNLNVDFVGVKQDIRMTSDAPLQTHYLYFAGAVAGFSLPAGFHVEASYRGTSRLWSGNSTVDARHTLDLAIKKRFAGNRLTLAATVKNLFDARSGYASYTEAFTSTTSGHEAWASRCFRLSLSWNFRSGGKFRSRQVESASEESKARLKKSAGQ